MNFWHDKKPPITTHRRSPTKLLDDVAHQCTTASRKKKMASEKNARTSSSFCREEDA